MCPSLRRLEAGQLGVFVHVRGVEVRGRADRVSRRAVKPRPTTAPPHREDPTERHPRRSAAGRTAVTIRGAIQTDRQLRPC